MMAGGAIIELNYNPTGDPKVHFLFEMKEQAEITNNKDEQKLIQDNYKDIKSHPLTDWEVVGDPYYSHEMKWKNDGVVRKVF